MGVEVCIGVYPEWVRVYPLGVGVYPPPPSVNACTQGLIVYSLGVKGFHARGLLEAGLRPLRVGVCPLGPKGYGAYRAICRGLPPGGRGLPLGGMGGLSPYG